MFPERSREKADERASRFGIISGQTRAFLYNPSFHHLLLKLIGSKEEVTFAKEIQKALKRSPPVYFSRISNTSRVPPGPYSRLRHKYAILAANEVTSLDPVGPAVTVLSTKNEPHFRCQCKVFVMGMENVRS